MSLDRQAVDRSLHPKHLLMPKQIECRGRRRLISVCSGANGTWTLGSTCARPWARRCYVLCPVSCVCVFVCVCVCVCVCVYCTWRLTPSHNEEVWAMRKASGCSLSISLLLAPPHTLTLGPQAAWWIKMEHGSVTQGSDSQPRGQTQRGLPLFKVRVRKGKVDWVWLMKSDASRCLMRVISHWCR